MAIKGENEIPEMVKKDAHKVNLEEAMSNERLLYEILNDAYPGEWESDTTFIEGRKFRGDAVNKERKIVVEIEGGLYPFYMTLRDGRRVKAMSGGHSSASGIQRDMEKCNFITVHGWKLLRYTPESIKKRPFELMRDIRLLCGYPEQGTQINLDNCKLGKAEPMQAHIS